AKAKEYQHDLETAFDTKPFLQQGACSFNTKRLIDVFLYTQYAHQPKEARQKQFNECLRQINGQRVALTWFFLVTVWDFSIKIGNVGRVITWWFERYCAHHNIKADILASIRDDHDGLGMAEKVADREARLRREKIKEIATELWKQDGSKE